MSLWFLLILLLFLLLIQPVGPFLPVLWSARLSTAIVEPQQRRFKCLQSQCWSTARPAWCKESMSVSTRLPSGRAQFTHSRAWAGGLQLQGGLWRCEDDLCNEACEQEALLDRRMCCCYHHYGICELITKSNRAKMGQTQTHMQMQTLMTMTKVLWYMITTCLTLCSVLVVSSQYSFVVFPVEEV